MLVFAHNFSQSAPNTIANNRASEAPARNKADSRRARTLYREDGDHHEPAALQMAPFFYTIKLRRAC